MAQIEIRTGPKYWVPETTTDITGEVVSVKAVRCLDHAALKAKHGEFADFIEEDDPTQCRVWNVDEKAYGPVETFARVVNDVEVRYSGAVHGVRWVGDPPSVGDEVCVYPWSGDGWSCAAKRRIVHEVFDERVGRQRKPNVRRTGRVDAI